MENLDLVVVENNVVNQENLNKVLVELKEIKKNLEEYEKNLKTKLMDTMIKNGETNYKLNNFNVSLVVGKDEEVFNKNEFVKKESDEILALFTEFTETKEFDLEKFKKENPEMYKKYTKINTTFDVDTKKLSKNFPEIYKKYITVVPSTRKPTIAFKEAK